MQRGRGSIKGRKRHWHRKTERKREKGELVTKQVRTKENHSKVTAVLTALIHPALTTCQLRTLLELYVISCYPHSISMGLSPGVILIL